MKFLISLFCLVGITNVSSADNLSPEDHATILKALNLGTLPLTEARSFYYADPNKNVIQIDNDAGSVSVGIISPSGKAGGANFYSQKTIKVEVSHSGNATVARSSEYFNFNGNSEVFSTDEITIADVSPDAKTLSISAVHTLYYNYKMNSSGTGTVAYPLNTPKVDKISATATQVLTITPDDTTPLGLIAAKKVGEDRDPGTGSCTISSATELNCDFSLETDYTPDTLHSTFKIEAGKVGELTDANVEPGC